jgi:CRISPR/Cas system CMR subunit Cmr6 (Cas7 group RAMP superfamily)
MEGLFMKEDKDQMDNQEDQEIFEKEIDQDALDVIKRLYDKTFKELVDR